MKNKFIIISVHVLAWMLLMLVPFLSTYQVLQSLVLDSKELKFIPLLVSGLGFILIFYINYFFLIPRFLFTKKYLKYILLFLGSIVCVLFFVNLVFYYFDFNPEKLEKINPIIHSIKPIAAANNILMLLISFVAAYCLALLTKMKQIEQEKLSAQIASLKSQINPHFLFNTLNSIYATAIEKSPQTAEMVAKLSEMMRYTMSETQNDVVDLEDEIAYVDNFIELQKMRLDDKVKLEYKTEGNFSGLKIAPMLLIPFIENSFKHGVNSEEDSNIYILIEVKESEFHLKVVNNKVQTQKETSERSGLGIENTKNRLQLIYPTKHMLSIKDTAQSFRVSLHINLQ